MNKIKTNLGGCFLLDFDVIHTTPPLRRVSIPSTTPLTGFTVILLANVHMHASLC